MTETSLSSCVITTWDIKIRRIKIMQLDLHPRDTNHLSAEIKEQLTWFGFVLFHFIL